MGFFLVISVLLILAAWVEHGVLGGILVFLAVGAAWALFIGADLAISSRRQARAEAVLAHKEDEAARRWAREELLRKDPPAQS